MEVYFISYGPVTSSRNSGCGLIHYFGALQIVNLRVALPFSCSITMTSPRARTKKSILPHIFNAAKNSIVTHWKQPQPPTRSYWLQKINHIYRMESALVTGQDVDTGTLQTWAPWLEFFTQMTILISVRRKTYAQNRQKAA